MKELCKTKCFGKRIPIHSFGHNSLRFRANLHYFYPQKSNTITFYGDLLTMTVAVFNKIGLVRNNCFSLEISIQSNFTESFFNFEKKIYDSKNSICLSLHIHRSGFSCFVRNENFGI